MSRMCALMLTSLLGAASAAPGRADAFDDAARREMAHRRVPGMAVAVVRDGKLERAAGYGLANVEQDVPATADTVFQIQSMTKSFTAAAVLVLVEEGKVGLDDPIGKYLAGTPEEWKDIRVRHLLSHTSGLKDFINDPTQSLRLDVSDADVLAATAQRPLDFAPGAKYAYSNTNYELLGMLIWKVTGKRWGDFVAERVFRPLGMESTRIYSWNDLVPHRAAGYLLDGDAWRNGEYIAPSVLSYPGGGILSTVKDLAKWDIALTEGKVLTEESRRRMWSPTRLNDGSESGYGFGWAVGEMNGHRFQTHSGGHVTGFSTVVLRLPDDHLSVFVLCNLGGADAFAIARRLAGRYVPAVLPAPEPAIEDKDPDITARLRSMLEGLRAGTMDDAIFTPEARAALGPDALRMAAGMLRSPGPIEAVELLARTEDAGGRRYRYRVRGKEASILVSFTLTPAGQIASPDAAFE